MDTLETLKEILGGMNIDMNAEDVNEYTSLYDEIGFDTFAISEFTSAVEEEFGIDLSDVYLDRLDTVGDVLDLIEDRI